MSLIETIKEYFKLHKLTGYRDFFFYYIQRIKERDLLKIVDKIKENPNNSGVVQILLHKTLEKYNFDVPKVKIKKKKASAKTNKERQIKFRNSSKKVVFQCMLDESFKNELIALKCSKNLTYEQLLKYIFDNCSQKCHWKSQ